MVHHTQSYWDSSGHYMPKLLSTQPRKYGVVSICGINHRRQRLRHAGVWGSFHALSLGSSKTVLCISAISLRSICPPPPHLYHLNRSVQETDGEHYIIKYD